MTVLDRAWHLYARLSWMHLVAAATVPALVMFYAAVLLWAFTPLGTAVRVMLAIATGLVAGVPLAGILIHAGTLLAQPHRTGAADHE